MGYLWWDCTLFYLHDDEVHLFLFFGPVGWTRCGGCRTLTCVYPGTTPAGGATSRTSRAGPSPCSTSRDCAARWARVQGWEQGSGMLGWVGSRSQGQGGQGEGGLGTRVRDVRVSAGLGTRVGDVRVSAGLGTRVGDVRVSEGMALGSGMLGWVRVWH